MALTTADLDALDKAIASGALTVKYADGSMVTYDSMAGLLQRRAYVANMVTPASTSTGANPRVSLATFQ